MSLPDKADDRDIWALRDKLEEEETEMVMAEAQQSAIDQIAQKQKRVRKFLDGNGGAAGAGAGE